MVENLKKDTKEEAEKISSIIDCVKPWMNYDLFNAVEKQKDQKIRDEEELKKIALNNKNFGIPDGVEVKIKSKDFDEIPDVIE